jgi:hypothetical protein
VPNQERKHTGGNEGEEVMLRTNKGRYLQQAEMFQDKILPPVYCLLFPKKEV